MNIGNFDSLLAEHIDEDTEFIPLLTLEDEEEIERERIPHVLPILPLKNTVLFPGVVVPISAGRDASIHLINEAYATTKTIGVVAQLDEKTEIPEGKDLFRFGTVARILRVLKMPDGNVTIIIQGKKRFEIESIVEEKPYIKAMIKEMPDVKPDANDKEFEATIEAVKDLSIKIVQENPNIPSEAAFAIRNIESTSFLINFISSNMNATVLEKQGVLEIDELKERATAILKYLNIDLQRLTLRNEVQSKTRIDIDQQQREYFLHQQMRTIQEELGGVSYEQEMEELKKKAKTKKWDDKIKELFEKELSKLQRTNPNSPDYGIQRNYLEVLLELPWNEYSKDNFDLKRAQKILDKEHYGLEEVKRRIIEYLAVLKLRNDMKSPILCFYGPPGVGKTSLGRSIAKALSREYVRMSLGGLHDEAEIRGHRKTYIGAMPGRILQQLKKAKTSNPVFVLDEIDKLGNNSYQGDPSSAMLEVLDPEQNKEFYDNFLEMGYDLSKVMFIATANDLSTIQPALLDRMELINVTGYTIEEKTEIAKRHLLPKQLKEHGMKTTDLQLGKKEIEHIVEGYTRESGVRALEKEIAKVVRYGAKNLAMEEAYDPKLTIETIEKILGPARLERDKYEDNEVAGVVTGLAWTSVGGDILFIESALSKGKGVLNITGNLGQVMKESATIALEYLKANAERYNLNVKLFDSYDVHIHVPEGATPKDGPSAGIAMLTSLMSLFTQKRVKKHLAMTGEITLRGKVLPVGGLKEKILAGKRAGIKEYILCKDNEKDILEIKQEYLKGLTFHYVTDMEEVIRLAITNQDVKHKKVLTFE
ncbi:endopeptidase La [Capnocytophaga sp. oral taxon 412 str. F0487]|uniref:endopeptidase La n=1 Tax=Capnocytophaga sp. oral taxon 412 TaxID=712218 RepID=UPI0002696227|nr:endopeptidase La [Capnocytophaga sp. oral taxon 412]EIW94170.1 endopeptidase La [Capnocytophaga sp. oral taxon 412 str. F0487]